jgi:hypothetical protein
VRLGIAHHYGWAVAVTATDDHDVVDRRRIELIEPGLPPAPIHHEGGPHAMHRAGAPLSDDELAALVVDVRAAVVRATAASLDELPAGISSISVRSWPPDFPTAVEIARRPPHESRADSVMYCQVLAELADARSWRVHLYDAATVEREAAAVLGERAEDVLHGPRRTLGPPWSKDHRTALAATVIGGGS